MSPRTICDPVRKFDLSFRNGSKRLVVTVISSDRFQILVAKWKTHGAGQIENVFANRQSQKSDHVPGRRHVVDHVDGGPDLQGSTAKQFRGIQSLELRTVPVYRDIQGIYNDTEQSGPVTDKP